MTDPPMDRFRLPDDPRPALAELEECMKEQAEDELRQRSARGIMLSDRIDDVCASIRKIASATLITGHVMPEVRPSFIRWLEALDEELQFISSEVHDL